MPRSTTGEENAPSMRLPSPAGRVTPAPFSILLSPQSAGRAAWILQSRLFPNWGGGFEHDAGTWCKVVPLATSKTAQQPREAPSCSSLSQAWTGNRRDAFLCFRKFSFFECALTSPVGVFFDILKLDLSARIPYEASVPLQTYHPDLHFKSIHSTFFHLRKSDKNS